MKDVDLHPAPHIAAVLGGMQVDAGVDPSFDEELAAEVEVLVWARGAQPRGVARALVDHDGAIAHVEGRFRPVIDGPACERSSIEERHKTGFAGSLRGG